MKDMKPFIVELRSWSTHEWMDVIVWSVDTDTVFEYFDKVVGRSFFRAKSARPLTVTKDPIAHNGNWHFRDRHGDIYEVPPSTVAVAVPHAHGKIVNTMEELGV